MTGRPLHPMEIDATMTDTTNERNRLIAFFEFAEQFTRMRATPPSSVGKHPFALHEFQVRRSPGVHVTPSGSSADDEVWRRVDRLHETKPPPIKNGLLRPWVKMMLSCECEPNLNSFVSAGSLIDAGTDAASHFRPFVDSHQRAPLDFYDAKYQSYPRPRLALGRLTSMSSSKYARRLTTVVMAVRERNQSGSSIDVR
jgi:hypothetical protein